MAKKPTKTPVKRDQAKSGPFENVKNQIAYCGLWCGSCSMANGRLNELARSCSKTITDYGVNEWGPKDIDYDSLLKGLASVSAMEPCVGCLRGGGKTNCEIRSCAMEKGIAECVECAMQSSCTNTKAIEIMRTGAKRVGMKVKETRGDRASQVKAWVAELK